MATYLELRRMITDSDLPNKVEVATIVFAQNLMSTGTPTTADKAWASSVFSGPAAEGRKVLMAVIAANKASTIEQIQAATDEQIQNQVDIIAPSLVDALAGV